MTDGNVAKIKQKAKAAVEQRGLCSCMNTTKWCELFTAIRNELPFAPPFAFKYLTQTEQPDTEKLKKASYFGDWGGENFPPQTYYFNIEYIAIQPRVTVRSTQYDARETLAAILKRIGVHGEQADELVIVYGYR